MQQFFESDDFKNECKKQFDEYDKDKSGFLDKTEMKAVLKELAASIPDDKGKSMEVTDKDVEEAMKDLDTNQDGKISLEEFSQLAIMVFTAILTALAEAAQA